MDAVRVYSGTPRAERLAQKLDVLSEQAGLAVSEIGGEKEAATRNKIAPIICHWRIVPNHPERWVSLRSTHPTGLLRELETLNREDDARHNPRTKSWMNKVKEFFGQ